MRIRRMIPIETIATESSKSYHRARWRFYSYEKRPLFHADWLDFTFHHFEVDSVELQKRVPLELDLYQGKAFVDLVAFRVCTMWIDRLGKWTSLPNAVIANHDFLNVRCYVKRRGEPGIYFMKEYVNQPLAIPLAERWYGLPYYNSKIDYDYDQEKPLRACIKRGTRALVYECPDTGHTGHQTCEAGSLDEFLCERYTAFTCRKGKLKVFRILHEPWKIRELKVDWKETTLLEDASPLLSIENYRGSSQSPGVRDVFISKPRNLCD